MKFEKFEISIRVKRICDGSYREHIYPTDIPLSADDRDLVPSSLRAAASFQSLLQEVKALPLPEADKCKGFRWMGQPLDHCEGCSAPIWEHDMVEWLEGSPFANPPQFKYLPISNTTKENHRKAYGQ